MTQEKFFFSDYDVIHRQYWGLITSLQTVASIVVLQPAQI